MATFNNIDEFIQEAFPYEYQKIIKYRESPIEKKIDEADNEFDEKLEEILKGKEEEPKPKKKSK